MKDRHIASGKMSGLESNAVMTLNYNGKYLARRARRPQTESIAQPRHHSYPCIGARPVDKRCQSRGLSLPSSTRRIFLSSRYIGMLPLFIVLAFTCRTATATISCTSLLPFPSTKASVDPTETAALTHESAPGYWLPTYY